MIIQWNKQQQQKIKCTALTVPQPVRCEMGSWCKLTETMKIGIAFPRKYSMCQYKICLIYKILIASCYSTGISFTGLLIYIIALETYYEITASLNIHNMNMKISPKTTLTG